MSISLMWSLFQNQTTLYLTSPLSDQQGHVDVHAESPSMKQLLVELQMSLNQMYKMTIYSSHLHRYLYKFTSFDRLNFNWHM